MNSRPRFVARRLTVLIAAAMALNALLANPLRGQTVPENGVLLLESGQLLEGQISQEGDRFLVKLPYGEIRLHSDQVKRRCATAQEAYLCLRTDQGPRANLDAHLRLARWCLQHQLLAEADDQLTLASRVAPADEPRIEELRRRIRTAFDAMTISRPAALDAASGGESDGAVVPAAHHAAAPGASTPRSRGRAAPPPADSISVSTDQLRVYTSQVQPMLLNGCSAIGCHGGRQATFNVYRPLGRTINRELTERNLQSVLKHIDRANPGQSPLLQMLANPHGGQQQPWAIESDPRYTAIAQWVSAVAQPAELPKTAQWQHPPQRLASAAPRRVAPASATAPAVAGVRPPSPARPQGAAAPQPAAEQADAIPETSPPTKPMPRNPFDPSEFNRRNHPSRK